MRAPCSARSAAMCSCTRATSSIPYRPRATPAWLVTTATGMLARLNLAIASGAPSMNVTRSIEPTYPWSTMIVPSRSSRTPGREHAFPAPDIETLSLDSAVFNGSSPGLQASPEGQRSL
jgi:hypothetical protein